MPAEMKQSRSSGIHSASNGLADHGLHNINDAFWNLGAPQLVEHAVRRREGSLAADGALVVRTGQFTGRSPKDKFIVRDETTDSSVQWGPVNQPMTEAHFDRRSSRMASFWQGEDVSVQALLVCACPEYTLPFRVVSQLAWHSLF